MIVAQAALSTFFDPAKNALLPTLVPAERLVSANALTGMNQNLGRLLGASLGGLLLTAGGVGVIGVCDAVTFLASAALIWSVRPARGSGGAAVEGAGVGTVGGEGAGVDAGADLPGSPPSPSPSPSPGTRGILARRPIRAGLAVTALMAAAQGCFLVAFVVFVARDLHGSAGENGLLRGVMAVGAVAVSAVLARAKAVDARLLTGFSYLAFGTVTLIAWNLYHVTTWEPVYAVLFMVVGGPGAAAATGLTTALQRAGTDGERGRVFAAFGATFAIGQGVGILAAGTLGDRVGLDAVLNAQGVMLLGSAAIALLWLGEGRRRDEDGNESGIGVGVGEPAGSRGAAGAVRGGAVAVESSQ